MDAGDGTIALPVLVRSVGEAGLADAVSPYGYPGCAVHRATDEPLEPAAIDWSATELVSVFVRERIGADPSFAGATKRSVVQVHDPSRARRLRRRFGEQIRRNERLGYRVEARPGPETSVGQRSSFHAVYTETMERASAAGRYYFDLDYFTQVLAFERSWLMLCRTPEETIASGAIVGMSDGMLHYYLGGTSEAHLDTSPFKNVADAMVELADRLGALLNLGGGVHAGDGLEDFKRGFSNTELPFHTHEIVCDSDAYEELSGGRPDTAFFPAYRAPGRRAGA